MELQYFTPSGRFIPIHVPLPRPGYGFSLHGILPGDLILEIRNPDPMSANFGWINFFETPLVNIGGAYFPAWLFCLLAALILFAVLHVVLGRSRFAELLLPPLLMIPVWVTLFSCVFWLLFFSA